MIFNEHPDVTVIVPTYQQDSTLEKCIQSLLSQNYEGHIDIIVVDNSESFVLGELSKKFPEITFLWEPKSGSYNARNKALEQTNTQIIAFTDSDCIAKEDWIARAVQSLLENKDVGFIVGKISVFPSLADKPTIAELYEGLFAFPQRTFLEKDHFGATANVVTTRDTIHKVGFFNGQLKSRGDMDWGQRATKSGFKGYYNDSAIVFHPARKHDEIIKKMKRVVAGARDKEPGWKNCMIYVYRFLRPPRRKIMKIFSLNDPHFNIYTKIRVSCYCLFLTWCEAFYRIKFELLKTSSPR